MPAANLISIGKEPAETAFTAIGMPRLLQNGTALDSRDQSVILKFQNRVFHARYIFCMDFPIGIAWANLVDAAAQRIDGFARWRVGIEVSIIRHAVVVTVHRQNLAKNGVLVGWRAIDTYIKNDRPPAIQQIFFLLVVQHER